MARAIPGPPGPKRECDHCQANDAPDLGPCCICEKTQGVRNIIMLSRRGVVSGHGWGCAQCDLPADGALAVLCDECTAEFQVDESVLKTACRGYPATEGRIAIADLPPGEFDHDPAKHAMTRHAR